MDTYDVSEVPADASGTRTLAKGFCALMVALYSTYTCVGKWVSTDFQASPESNSNIKKRGGGSTLVSLVVGFLSYRGRVWEYIHHLDR